MYELIRPRKVTGTMSPIQAMTVGIMIPWENPKKAAEIAVMTGFGANDNPAKDMIQSKMPI